jgi:hypothetical protein
VNNLSRKALRKIIFEEIANLLQDDALFSRDDLTDAGTGTIINLDDMEDNESIEFDIPVQSTSCSSCGGGHELGDPCSAIDDTNVDVDFQNQGHGNFTGNIDDLTPQEAFAAGLAMGQSGDFD